MLLLWTFKSHQFPQMYEMSGLKCPQDLAVEFYELLSSMNLETEGKGSLKTYLEYS